MIRKKEIVLERFGLLCTKHHDVLVNEDVWQVDTLFSVVWSSYDDGKDYYSGGMVAEDIPQNPFHERRISVLIKELNAIYEELAELGISYDDVRNILWESQKVSRLQIGRSCNIELPDYGLTVTLTPLQWAVYMLFIHHPEGIRLKEMIDYQEELRIFLLNSTTTDSNDKVLRETERLTDPTSGAINENISRIRRAFINAIGDDSLARHYYINGTRGMNYTVPLNRNLISFVNQ